MMASNNTYGGGGILFSYSPISHMVAVASSSLIPLHMFAGDGAAGIAAAKWQAQPYESRDQFQNRIRSALASDGVSGVIVTIYAHPGYWHVNAPAGL